MARIVIKYLSGDGSLSTRSISDWSPDGEDAVEAFCHLRNERRTFKMMRILSAVDEESGELLANPWRVFNLDRTRDGRETLVARLGDKVLAIKILKFYAKSTRGFAKSERDHILNFALQGVGASPFPRDEADSWLQTLWAGDVHAYISGDDAEYRTLLSALPAHQLREVRVTAELIARGSGRKAISPEAAQRIARDFSN